MSWIYFNWELVGNLPGCQTQLQLQGPSSQIQEEKIYTYDMGDNERKRKRTRFLITETEEEGVINGRQRLRDALLENYAEVRIPKRIRDLIESTGLTQSELFFKLWWVTPSPLFGNFTPEQMWNCGGKELVIDHLFALAGDQHDLIQETLRKIRSTKV